MNLTITAIGGPYTFTDITNLRAAKNELRWTGAHGKNSMAHAFIKSWTLTSGDPMDKHHAHLDPDGTGQYRWHCSCGDHSNPLRKDDARVQGMGHAITGTGTGTWTEADAGGNEIVTEPPVTPQAAA